MATPVSIEQRIEILFQSLNTQAAAKSLPSQGTLASQLNDRVRKTKKNAQTITIPPNVGSLFATAAVEMWQRAVHSFLISASLTKLSPQWASVSGYYASHYTVRGFAHLLGFFQLFRAGRILKIDIMAGTHYCEIIKKNAKDGEHKVYWRIVKSDRRFTSDPLFTLNLDDEGKSDSSHRFLANYWDHVYRFPNFQPLDRDTLKSRVEYLSSVHLSTVPIPDREKYPDVDDVQLIAYHRIVRFRSFLDEILRGSNRFWSVHRLPGWCTDFMDFQVVEPSFVSSYGTQS